MVPEFVCDHVSLSGNPQMLPPILRSSSQKLRSM